MKASRKIRQTPYLAILPSEIQQKIVSYCSARELIALREVCRPLEAASFDAFGTKCFTNRRCELHPETLESLVEVCQHPILVKYIRSIKLGTYAHRIRGDVDPELSLELFTDALCAYQQGSGRPLSLGTVDSSDGNDYQGRTDHAAYSMGILFAAAVASDVQVHELTLFMGERKDVDFTVPVPQATTLRFCVFFDSSEEAVAAAKKLLGGVKVMALQGRTHLEPRHRVGLMAMLCLGYARQLESLSMDYGSLGDGIDLDERLGFDSILPDLSGLEL